MNVNINKRGQSFKGVTAYLLHDKKADTSERFEWGVVENTYLNNNNNGQIQSDYDNIQQASKLMAWTDKNRDFIKLETGGNLSNKPATAGNVYHYSLSWSKDEKPSREHMEETGRAHIKMMGLDEHQYYMVSHSDTDHKHLHIVANLVHPETGYIDELYKDFDNSDRWANEYEKEHGIVSHDRAKKYEAWENDRPAYDVKELKAKYAELATFSYHHSDGMASFKAALEDQGLTLSGGRKSHVVVSTEGDIYNLSKLIDFQEEMKGRGAATKALNEKLEGLDKTTLPDTKELAEERKHFDRDQSETDQQNALDDAAHEAAKGIAEATEKEEALQHQENQAAKDLLERIAENKEKNERIEKTERWAEYQKYIDKKTLESRQNWSIDELALSRDNAAQYLADNSGFWASKIGKKSQAEAAHNAAENNLHEQRIRHEQDILVINEKRPAWLKAKELEKHGFEAGAELEQIERGNTTAHAKTSKERGLFAHIKAKITERANKKEAEKTALSAELKEREHQRESVAKAVAVVEAKQRNERMAKEAAKAESQQKETFERVRRLNLANQFKENAEQVNKPTQEAAKLQRNMTDEELQQHKDNLRAEYQAETTQDTPAQEFEEVAAHKQQRDMNAEELAAYRDDLREDMRAERERTAQEAYERAMREQTGQQLDHEGNIISNDNDLERD